MRMRIGLSLLLCSTIAFADGEIQIGDPADPVFDESAACPKERFTADEAAKIPTKPDDASAQEDAAKARRKLAEATTAQGKQDWQRALNSALARIEDARAWFNEQVARRDATAKIVRDCVARERNAFAERVALEKAAVIQRAKEEAVERERVTRIMGNKTFVQFGVSALICIETAARATALNEIAQEKKYARIGGVQDNVKLYDLQQEIKRADLAKARRVADLKSHKAQELSCSTAIVKKVMACVSPREDIVEENDPCFLPPLEGPVQAAQIVLWLDRSRE